jgi:serine/threonine protein kinase
MAVITSSLFSNPADMLVGETLEGGWTVTRKIERPPDATGGTFCVGYEVEHQDGRQGFLKALDFQSVFVAPDPTAELQKLTANYNFERDMLRTCGEYRMTRVAVSIADGSIRVGQHPIPVSYIIFDRASGDIRSELSKNPGMTDAQKLSVLHNVATGLKQLHSRLFAHQDLKPSNVLQFDFEDSRISKVGDLGRAAAPMIATEHDKHDIAGDPNYAPIEHYFGHISPEFAVRRIACDLYQLGSFACFLFTGGHINGFLAQELHNSHHPGNWNDTYEAVFPYILDAFQRVIDKVQAGLPGYVASDLIEMIAYLCHPDPAFRGNPASRRGHGNPYALDRVVTKLDLLTKRAKLNASRAS